MITFSECEKDLRKPPLTPILTFFNRLRSVTPVTSDFRLPETFEKLTAFFRATRKNSNRRLFKPWEKAAFKQAFKLARAQFWPNLGRSRGNFTFFLIARASLVSTYKYCQYLKSVQSCYFGPKAAKRTSNNLANSVTDKQTTTLLY